MKKLITTAMVAVLGLFGAIDNGRVTLVSSASAGALDSDRLTLINTSSVKAALRRHMNALSAAHKTNNTAAIEAATAALQNYLVNNALAASSVADVLATLPSDIQARVASSVGTAMAGAQQTLIANGSPAALKVASELTKEVQQMPPLAKQAAVSSFQNAGGNPTYGYQGGTNPPAGSGSSPASSNVGDSTGGGGGGKAASPT